MNTLSSSVSLVQQKHSAPEPMPFDWADLVALAVLVAVGVALVLLLNAMIPSWF